MARIRYKVTLEEPERQRLKEITTRGRHSSQKVLNALILLKCDEGRFQDRKLTHQAIADVLPVSLKKIDRVKRRFVEQGLEAALEKRKPERTYRRKADGDFEAHLIAVSCGKPPPGTPAGRCACWPTAWWNWNTWTPSPMRRCVAF